jgi:hypothetical protein
VRSPRDAELIDDIRVVQVGPGCLRREESPPCVDGSSNSSGCLRGSGSRPRACCCLSQRPAALGSHRIQRSRRSGGQGVASSNLASPTKPIHPIRPSRTCIQPTFLPPSITPRDGRARRVQPDYRVVLADSAHPDAATAADVGKVVLAVAVRRETHLSRSGPSRPAARLLARARRIGPNESESRTLAARSV